jgi:hypothetical protein
MMVAYQAGRTGKAGTASETASQATPQITNRWRD